jgi:hypothetical protein
VSTGKLITAWEFYFYWVLLQPFSILLPWRNPLNKFQVSGNPCINVIISTAHGTLAWPVSCRYNNLIIIVNAVLSTEWYFSVDLFILAKKFKKRCLYIFFQSRSLAEPLATCCETVGFRGTPVEKPWSTVLLWLPNYQQDHFFGFRRFLSNSLSHYDLCSRSLSILVRNFEILDTFRSCPNPSHSAYFCGRSSVSAEGTAFESGWDQLRNEWHSTLKGV